MLTNTEEHLDLTGAQQGIWQEMTGQPGSPAFNSAEYVELVGDLDVDAFSLAVEHAVGEAEALRVRFVRTARGPRQVVVPAGERPLDVVDLGGHADPRAEALARMRADLGGEVDLADGPLAVQLLFRLGEGHFLWYQRVHTLLVDAFSLFLLTRRVAERYTALVTGEEDRGRAFRPLARLLASEAAYRRSDRASADRAFWAGRTAAQPPPVSLSAAWPAAAAEHFLRASAVLPAELMSRVRRAERLFGTSWPVLLTGCTALYLSTVLEVDDVVLGLFCAARHGTDAADVPAMVSNVLPLHLPVRPGWTVEHHLALVLDTTVSALAHQRLRHEEIRESRRSAGEPGPLFGPLLNLVPFPRDVEFAGVRGRTHNLSTGPVDDLSAAVYEVRGPAGETTLAVDVDTNPRLYTQGDTAAHARGVVALLDAFVGAAPTTRLSDVVAVVSPDENGQPLPRPGRTVL